MDPEPLGACKTISLVGLLLGCVSLLSTANARVCPGNVDDNKLTPEILKNKYTNCTVIDGDFSLSGVRWASVYYPRRFNKTYGPTNPSHEFDALLSIVEIRGCLNVRNFELHSLEFLRNVRKTQGCGKKYPGLTSTGLAVSGHYSKVKYLGLTGLRDVGAMAYIEKSICYVRTLNWTSAMNTSLTYAFQGRVANCSQDKCNDLCSDTGCIGPELRHCYGCRYAALKGTCFSNCSAAARAFNLSGLMYLDPVTKQCSLCDTVDECNSVAVCLQHKYIKPLSNGTHVCLKCHAMCSGGCNGASPLDCNACTGYFRSMPSLGAQKRLCVTSCNDTEYLEGKQCKLCHPQCQGGCTNSSATDCSACRNNFRQLQIAGSTKQQCITSCNTMEYLEDKQCKPCHSQCDGGCSNSSTTDCNACRNNFRQLQVAGSTRQQCVASCNAMEYLEDNKECKSCHSQCLGGCTNSSATDCNACSNYFRQVSGTTYEQCIAVCTKTAEYYQNDECKPCHDTCSGGCSGDGPTKCMQCRTAYRDVNANTTECLLTCPTGYSSVRLPSGLVHCQPHQPSPVSTDPASTGPVSTGSVSTGPISTGPGSSVSSGPVLTGPVSTGSVSTGPVSTGSVSTSPFSTGPGSSVSTGPVSTGSVSTGPVSTGPVSSNSVLSNSVLSGPASDSQQSVTTGSKTVGANTFTGHDNSTSSGRDGDASKDGNGMFTMIVSTVGAVGAVGIVVAVVAAVFMVKRSRRKRNDHEAGGTAQPSLTKATTRRISVPVFFPRSGRASDAIYDTLDRWMLSSADDDQESWKSPNPTSKELGTTMW